MSDALCADPGRDPRDWDPMDGKEAASRANIAPHSLPRIRKAIQVCHRCPIWQECLRTGIETRQTGVWGGQYLSREALRRKANAA